MKNIIINGFLRGGTTVIKLIDAKEILCIHVHETQRLGSLGGSKGNQVKWFDTEKNIYVKLDCLGYEGKAEKAVSHFLGFTNLGKGEYVEYHVCGIIEDGKYLGTGCYSENFVKPGEKEVTVADILDTLILGYAITYDELRDSLYPVIGFDAKGYIDKILCIDAIIRNEDRHFRNISFLCKNGVYTPARIYDNGAGCLSDLLTYPMEADFDSCLNRVMAKPFSINFLRQLQGVKPLYVKYDEYLSAVDVHEARNVRIINVIKRGLAETEGIAWVRS